MSRPRIGRHALFALSLLATSAATWAADRIASLDEKPLEKTIDLQPGDAIPASIDKARESYRRFLELVTGEPRLEAEAMRRLADLELEATEAERLASNVDALEQESFDNAVSLFRQLLATYPDYHRNDAVLYQLARAYETGGASDDSLRTLTELVARFPGTPRIDEVQFRRGEMLFLRREFEAAESAYGEVVRFGDSSRYFEQALYKLGWSRFKLGRHHESLGPFFDLLDRKLENLELAVGDTLLSGLNRADRELVDDTFRALSIGFSYMEGARSIVEYLEGRGDPHYSFVIFMNLGNLYLEKERYVDAAGAYEAFIVGDPFHPQSPLLQMEVIEAYRQGEFPTLVLEGKKRFVERYGMDSAFWERNAGQHDVAVRNYLKANLDDLARYYHAEAQESGDRADYALAALWYRKYLDYFPGEADSAGTNFLLAEILFESGEFAEATVEYERAAYDYPGHAHSSDAGYAALLSYRAREEQLQGETRRDWHRRYLDSGIRFADAWPGHDKAGTVLVTVAEGLFRLDDFELAITVAQSALGRSPPLETSLERTAWTVMAHSLFDLGRFADAEAASYRLRPLTPTGDSAALRSIDERIAASIYRQGELARDEGDLESAVTHFTRLGAAVPDSPVRETAEYDAAATLINLEDWDRASAVLRAFRRDFPDSAFADDVSRKLALSYTESGRSADAAEEFERIAAAAGSDAEERRDALWQAASLYRTVRQPADEERVLDAIVTRYPSPIAQSIEASFRLVELAEIAGDERTRSRRLRDIVRADRGAGEERSERTLYLAARASLELAEPARRRFTQARVTQPLADSLKRKKALMEEVLSAYGEAAEFGVAEVTTAATYRLGEVYQQFSRDLLESERPPGLDADALEQYDLLLEEQAFPFEEKAIALFEANAARAAEGIYDEWLRRTFLALAELVPARYAKLERSEDVVTAIFR